MKKFIAALALGALLVPALPSAAFADDHRDHDRGNRSEHHDNDNDNRDRDDNHRDNDRGRDRDDHRGPPARASRNWHGWNNRDHDIRSFRTRDYAAWRGGHWWRGRHGGQDGWFWVVGNLFYNYPRAVYPYPDPYIPAAVLEEGPPGDDYWYYCPDPSGYYPYVQQCYAPWRAVQQ